MKITPVLLTIALCFHAAVAQDMPKDAGAPDTPAVLPSKPKKTVLGAGVAEALAASTATREITMANIYTEGKLPVTAEAIHKTQWEKVPEETLSAAFDRLAAKETLDAVDAALITDACENRKWPQLDTRKEEILALFPANEWLHYAVKYWKLEGVARRPNASAIPAKEMTPGELVLITDNPSLGMGEFHTLRRIMAEKLMAAVTAKRIADGLAVDQASLDTAMAPVVVALNAPLWAGLRDAVADYGVDLPAPDYTAFIAGSNDEVQRVSSLPNRTRQVSRLPGSLVFLKGTSDFNAWAESLNMETTEPMATPKLLRVKGPGKGMAGKAMAGKAMVEDTEDVAKVRASKPHSGYLQRLKTEILKASARGDTVTRDRLIGQYQPWMDKYPGSGAPSKTKVKMSPNVPTPVVPNP